MPLAVVARDQSERQLFLFRNPRQLAVHDQVIRMLVVRREADELADLVQ